MQGDPIAAQASYPTESLSLSRFLASTIFAMLARISSSDARAHRSFACADAAGKPQPLSESKKLQMPTSFTPVERAWYFPKPADWRRPPHHTRG
jgi:hypothetical protein